MKKTICLLVIAFVIISELSAKNYPGLSYVNHTLNISSGIQNAGWPPNMYVIADPGDSLSFYFWDCQPCLVPSCVGQWYFDGDSIPNSYGSDPLNVVVPPLAPWAVATYSVEEGCYGPICTFTIWSTTTTGIETFHNLNFLNVFPTSVNSSITIQLNSIQKNDVEISFFDMNGRQLKNDFYKNVFGEFIKNENTEALAKGIYFLRIRAGEDVVEKKFVKM